MTRRIALAILVTVWAMLIAGCVVAYATVRWALIEQLDQSLVAKASTLPELTRVPSGLTGTPPAAREPATTQSAIAQPMDQPVAGSPRIDAYVVKADNGATLSPTGGGMFLTGVRPLEAWFSALGDGTAMRNVLVRGTARTREGLPIGVTVAYRSDASHMYRLLDRLTLAFVVFGVAAGLGAALVALRVSRSALRPLHATAAVIGEIDSQSLDRRIDAAKLPVELVPMANRLNEMLGRIERAYAQRHQFLADASHELRTPVAALVTTMEVSLRRPRQAESYRNTLETSLADAQLLRHLVEKLMEQCRADELSFDEVPGEVDLAPLLNQCADQVAALAQGREITVRRDVPAELRVVTQTERVRSVVTNLLSNAVEYNRPGGSVELEVRPNGRILHLTVRDTGVGIGADHIPNLFEPFYRAGQARYVQPGHLGLGLSLVRSHIQALGGQIRVESKLGEGTAFHVDLPMVKAVPAGEATADRRDAVPLIGLS